MYITYCCNQTSADPVDRTKYRLGMIGGPFRPTFVIRTSDWEKIPGTEANDGYVAISYCWEQSGEIIKNEKKDGYKCIDQPKHCIVEGYDLENDHIFVPSVEQYQLPDDDVKKQQSTDNNNNVNKEYSDHVSWCEPKCKKTTHIRKVTFKKLLQQICKDFQIDYLWFDQQCIDQSSNETKLKELKQMHCIYSNARYTMALIPEIHLRHPKELKEHQDYIISKARDRAILYIGRSRWWKRSWTLEEVVASKGILFVGANTHFWQHSLVNGDLPTTPDVFSVGMLDFFGHSSRKTINEEGKEMLLPKNSINQALNQAHFRTSSKLHDKILALANIFPSVFQHIPMDYTMNVHALFKNLYCHFASTDLSILCFGSNTMFLGIASAGRPPSTMLDHGLPSWTGVAGCHIIDYVHTIIPVTLFSSPYFVDKSTMLLHIKTRHYKSIRVSKYEAEDKERVYKQLREIETSRYNNKVQEITQLWKKKELDEEMVLLNMIFDMHMATSRPITHHYSHSYQDVKEEEEEGSFPLPICPLSLTEEVSDEEDCILLPILFQSHGVFHNVVDKAKLLCEFTRHRVSYLLPVFKKCTTHNINSKNTENEGPAERYKAVGIFYVGNPGLHGFEDDPNVLLHKIFPAGNNEIKEFCVE